MATDPETLTDEPRESARRSRTPGWVAEVVEVMELRRGVLVTTAFGLSLLGVLTALALPGFLPPRPLVGFAVGLAAVLLSVAVALGVDSVDLRIRGPRHVRASGGRLAAQLAGPPDAEAAAPLAAAVAHRVDAGRTRIALTPASSADDEDVAGWADALARALSARGLRVLLVDLVPDREDRLGVADVAAGRCRLAEAVDFDHDLMLASVGPGRNRREALDGLTELAVRLPSDIEVLVVALPHLGEPGALAGAGSLDRVLVVVEADATPRVDLIAALDALDTTPVGSEVVLLDPVDRPMVTAWELVAASVPPMPAASTAPAAADVPSVVEGVAVDDGASPLEDEEPAEPPTGAAGHDIEAPSPAGDGADPADPVTDGGDGAVAADGEDDPDDRAVDEAGPGGVDEAGEDAVEDSNVEETAGGQLDDDASLDAEDAAGGPLEADAPRDAGDALGDADGADDGDEADGEGDGHDGDAAPTAAGEPEASVTGAVAVPAVADPVGGTEDIDGPKARDPDVDESGDVWGAADEPSDEPDDVEPSDDALGAAATVAAYEAEHVAEGLDPDEPRADPAWEPRAPDATPTEDDEAADPFAGQAPDGIGLVDETDELEPVRPFSRPEESRRDGDGAAPEGRGDDVPSVIHLDDDVRDGDGAPDHTEPREPTDWAFPGEDDGPVRPGSLEASPFEGRSEGDDDPLRVAAALQTLAHEVWSREEHGD